MTTRCLSLGLNGYRGGGKTEKGKSWDLMLAQMKKLVWNATVCLIIVINIISMLTRPKLNSAQRPWLFLAFKRSNLCLTYVCMTISERVTSWVMGRHHHNRLKLFWHIQDPFILLPYLKYMSDSSPTTLIVDHNRSWRDRVDIVNIQCFV